MKFEKTKQFILSRASERLSSRIDAINKKRFELGLKKLRSIDINQNNSKIVGHIKKNKMDRYNPNLIPDLLGEDIFNNCYVKKLSEAGLEGDIIYKRRKENLQFQTISEVFWGTEEELEDDHFVFFIFYYLLIDLLQSEHKGLVESCLVDSVTYARAKAYSDVAIDDRLYFVYEKFLDEDEPTELYKTKVTLEAILRLYRLSFEEHNDFLEHYRTFFLTPNNTIIDVDRDKTFKHFDKHFNDFCNVFLFAFLKTKKASTSSLGLKMYSDTYWDWELLDELLFPTTWTEESRLTRGGVDKQQLVEEIRQIGYERQEEIKRMQLLFEGDFSAEADRLLPLLT